MTDWVVPVSYTHLVKNREIFFKNYNLNIVKARYSSKALTNLYRVKNSEDSGVTEDLLKRNYNFPL